MTRRWTPWTLALGLLAAAGCDSTPAAQDAGADVSAQNDVGGNDIGAVTDTPATGDTPAPTDTPVAADTPAPTDTPVAVDTPTPTDAPVPTDTPAMVAARTTPTQGGAVAMSADGTLAVAVNRTANSVSVFRMNLGATPPTAMAPTTLAIAGSEPWSVVLSNDARTAYVALRRSGQVAVIEDLQGTPRLGARVAAGSEPTGIAISPLGQRLFVANWSDGTVTAFSTATMMIAARIDLNAALAASGMLGPVAGRPALAHPRVLAVTNNGDGVETDETLYVTEFYSQARTDTLPVDDATFDVGRQGVLYRVSLADNSVGAPITLAPTANTGFNDSAGGVTGCFPNQLGGIAINNNRVYVTGICASPRGPTGPVTRMDNSVDTSNFKTQVHAGVWAVDTAMNREVVGEGLLLTRAFQARYDANMVPDTAARRMPLIPSDISFVPGARIAYVTAYGSDAVYRLDLTTPTSPAVGAGTSQHFIDLAPGGRLPVGISVLSSQRAVVINENTRNLSLIDLSLQASAGVQASAPAPTGVEAEANTGRRFFVTGLARWSLRGQAWNSCESCHPDGQTDNVTWFFARGPRQTTSLDGTYGPGGVQRVLNWTGIFDEVHDFELNTRGNSGGVGAIVHRANDGATPPAVTNADRVVFDGTAATAPQVATATNQAALNGSTRSMMPGSVGSNAVRSALRDWEDIDTYVRAIRAPNAPSNLNPTDVAAGRALFIANNCAGCHGSPAWTISRRFWTPSETTNSAMGTLRTTRYTLPAGFPAGLNPPANNMTRSAALRFDDLPNAGANDQINCLLRSVGTFPAMLGTNQPGVAPAGVLVREVRANMTTNAQGATGFNPPSLVGMLAGAPYYHAGNARTLEEAFSNTFAQHHQAFAANFLVDGAGRAEQLRQIVAFVLSIDDSTTAIPVPQLPGGGAMFNPDVCPTSL